MKSVKEVLTVMLLDDENGTPKKSILRRRVDETNANLAGKGKCALCVVVHVLLIIGSAVFGRGSV